MCHDCRPLNACPLHKAFGVIAFLYGFGAVVAPAFGGYLSYPARTMPSAFNGTMFEQFPFLLPMLMNTLLACACLCAGIAYAPETRSFIERKAKKTKKNGGAVRKTVELGKKCGGPYEEDHEENYDTECRCLLKTGSVDTEDKEIPSGVGDFDDEGDEIRSVLGSSFRSTVTSTPFLVIWIGAALNTGCTMLEELSPLYMKTDRDLGGMSFSPRRIATVMIVGGLSLLAWQLFIYERIIKRFGAVATMTAAMLIMVPVSFVQPAIGAGFGSDPSSNVAAQISLFAVYQSLQAFVLGTCFPAWFLLQNNSVSDAIKGRINGAAQTVTNVMSMFAPLLAGSTFALSLTVGEGDGGTTASTAVVKYRCFIAFIPTSAIFGAGHLLSRFLPKSLDRPYEKPSVAS